MSISEEFALIKESLPKSKVFSFCDVKGILTKCNTLCILTSSWRCA